jgi:sulfite exporter TauE/SafE
MLWSAFILGLLGSLHCVGMCGPIAFMLPVGKSNSTQKRIQVSLYHLGRLVAYAGIGLVFGIIGESFATFGVQQQLSIAVGIVMILLVILPQKQLQAFKFTQPLYKFIGWVKKELGLAFKKDSFFNFFQLGFFNGLLPCGLVYMAVFASVASAKIIDSMFYMLLFGLGTVPMMTSVIYFKGFIQKLQIFNFKKVIPYAVVLIGALFILRGMGLGIPYVSPKPAVEEVSAAMECH